MFKAYTSVPTQVQAVQFTDENTDMVHNSLTGQYYAGFEDKDPVLWVTTAHGDVVVVRFGDWIVKDAELGTYYPVKDEIFRARYV